MLNYRIIEEHKKALKLQVISEYSNNWKTIKSIKGKFAPDILLEYIDQHNIPPAIVKQAV